MKPLRNYAAFIMVLTFPRLPEAVTLNEESSMVTTTTITVSWTNPNSTVDYYGVRCSDGTASPAIVDSSDHLIASCIGLSTPGDRYNIYVATFSNGTGITLSITTITALPESVTLNEESNMVNTTTITASWSMPNGLVEYYEVSCSNGTASPAKIDSSDDLIASCTGLSTPGDNYTISVTSVSNGKLSAASTITITASIECTVPSLEVRVSSSCSPGTSVSYNHQCNFSCPTGYSLTDSSFVTCTIYGSFSEAFPRCEVIACTVPSLEENVFSSCSSGDPVSYNRQCYFVCQIGFSLTGPPSVTCTDSESFSQMFPRCEVACIVPSLEENVFSSCSPCTSVNHNDICSFSCATGYNLIGSSSVTCTSSGSFSQMFPRCEECDPNVSEGHCPETENLVLIDLEVTLTGDDSRRKRAAVPIGSSVVQNLLDSIVIAVHSLPEVISVNGSAISANYDVINLITASVGLDVTFRNDITIQQLKSLVIASINNIPRVDVQSFGLLTDPCSLDNPCGNGATCVRVEPGSANVICTESTIDTDMATLGVLIGLIVVVVALLLYAVTITVLLIQLRRKVPTKTEENGPDRYMDLEHRPEADRTYQEMAITSTASSTRPGERRLPSSNLIYENQNVAANEITEGVDYENVITPI